MDVVFIDGSSAADNATRRQIRSHVMKGRNAGRVILGRGRKYATAPSSEGPKAARTAGAHNPETWRHVWTSSRSRLSADSLEDKSKSGFDVPSYRSFKEAPLKSIQQATFSLGLRNAFAGQELSFCCDAGNLTPTTRQLLHLAARSDSSRLLHPSEFCSVHGMGGSPISWLVMTITNPAFLNCQLALWKAYAVSTCLIRPAVGPGGGINDYPPDLETTRQVARSLRLVNEDLTSTIASNRLPSDGTIAAIVSLLIHANVFGLGPSSAVHIRGLQQVIALRHGPGPAGFVKLRLSNAYLAQKIRRADLDLAIRSGGKPRFFMGDDAPEMKALENVLERWDVPLLALPAPWHEAKTLLQQNARVVRALCRMALLAPESANLKLHPTQFQDVFLGLVHSLVEFAPLAMSRPLGTVDNALHLGLLGFVTTLLDRNGLVQVFHTKLLAERMRDEILAPDVEASPRNGPDAKTRLWVCFVYGLVMKNEIQSNTRGNKWWLGATQSLALTLGVSSWSSLKHVLIGFAWVPALHDARGQELWRLVVTAAPRTW